MLEKEDTQTKLRESLGTMMREDHMNRLIEDMMREDMMRGGMREILERSRGVMIETQGSMIEGMMRGTEEGWREDSNKPIDTNNP